MLFLSKQLQTLHFQSDTYLALLIANLILARNNGKHDVLLSKTVKGGLDDWLNDCS